MSSHHNRRRRKASEPPVLVERLKKTEQGHLDQTQTGGSRLTYEEANWAKLSPAFREAHNRLRQARGLDTLPPPAVDLYVKPRQPLLRPFDPADKEFIKVTREFLGSTLMGGGEEGFSVNGKMVK